jgi:signal transduction histidine kinase
LNIAVKRLKESVKNGSVRDLKMKIEYIDQLEKKYKVNFMNEDIIELLHESIEGLERINKIVKGLRMFSRADQDDVYEKFDLNFIIENTLLVAANEIKYHAKIERNLGDIPSIYGIPSQIDQVLLNIILNASYAIKMSRKDRQGIITINTYQKDSSVICEIIDNGSGIPKSIISQIFNPFFTTKPVGEGTGLGLSISYDIIKNKHNGDIEIESIEGIGTKFTLRFPCEDCKSR